MDPRQFSKESRAEKDGAYRLSHYITIGKHPPHETGGRKNLPHGYPIPLKTKQADPTSTPLIPFIPLINDRRPSSDRRVVGFCVSILNSLRTISQTDSIKRNEEQSPPPAGTKRLSILLLDRFYNCSSSIS